jgi:micrococcal nuclease
MTTTPAPTPAPAPAPAPAWTYRAEVTRVIDGDTLELDVDLGFYVHLQHTRIRVLGLWSPERNTPQGAAASLFALALLGANGAGVVVRTELARSFERYVGDVVLADGSRFADRMIAAGHGTATRAPTDGGQ